MSFEQEAREYVSKINCTEEVRNCIIQSGMASDYMLKNADALRKEIVEKLKEISTNLSNIKKG